MEKIEGLVNGFQFPRMLGLKGSSTLSIFRHCFPDFPQPALITKHKAQYFKREEVITWFEKHGVRYDKGSEA